MNDRPSSIEFHIELTLRAHGVPNSHIIEADPKGSNLALTYLHPATKAEAEIYVNFKSNREAFDAYVYVKTDERYNFAKPKVSIPAPARSFDVV